MWRLIKYLEENCKEIIDSRSEDKLLEIAKILSEIRPECDDKERHELAIAVVAAMWLGYSAQGKEAAAFLRDAIFEAFEVGKRSAMMQ
jgi:hypothetical protein